MFIISLLPPCIWLVVSTEGPQESCTPLLHLLYRSLRYIFISSYYFTSAANFSKENNFSVSFRLNYYNPQVLFCCLGFFLQTPWAVRLQSETDHHSDGFIPHRASLHSAFKLHTEDTTWAACRSVAPRVVAISHVFQEEEEEKEKESIDNLIHRFISGILSMRHQMESIKSFNNKRLWERKLTDEGEVESRSSWLIGVFCVVTESWCGSGFRRFTSHNSI